MFVDHIAVSVVDLEAMTEWYCGRLEARVEYAVDRPAAGVRGVVLALVSGARIELLAVRHPDGAATARPELDDVDESLRLPGYHHLALRVDDVGSAFDAFLRAGATSVGQPRAGSRAGITVAFVTDPEHNLIELIAGPPA